METDQFLQRILPDSGTYFIGYVPPNGKYRQSSIGDYTAFTQQIASRTDQQNNVYYATGTFNGDSRKAIDVAYKKTFYLDLDCGEGKGFADKPAAINELAKFLRLSGITAPNVIVDSGHGIHVYWALSKSITKEQWQPLANALAQACKDLSFDADHSVTADAARILRVPGTLNTKDPNTPIKCRVVRSTPNNIEPKDFALSLKKWLGPRRLKPDSQVDLINDDLALPKQDYQDKYAKYMVPECAVFADMHANHGDGCNETEWMAALGTLHFCRDGEDWIHTLSSGHPEYTEAKTEAKFRTRIESIERSGAGAATCERWAFIYHKDLCGGCPHNGRIKSPIALGKPPIGAEESTENTLPSGYIEGNGKIYRRTEDGFIPVVSFLIEDVQLIECNEVSLIRFTENVDGDKKAVEFDLALLANYRELFKSLSNQCVVIPPKPHPQFNMVTLMGSWVDQLRTAKQVTAGHTRFGWCVDRGRHGFSCGSDLYWDDGTSETTIMVDKHIAMQYEAKGDLETWKHAAKFVIDQDRPAINCAIASAFAAPLVHFTVVPGTLLAIVSEKSGTGKSTALKVANTVWGDPISGINSLSDTQNSIAKKMGIINNLPAYWDEIRLKDSVDSFIRMMFQLGQGKEKQRLTQAATMVSGGTWQTMIVAASNESLTDHIDDAVEGSDAGRRRIFELQVEPLRCVGDDFVQANAALKELSQNYGHAGRVYARFLVKNYTQVKEAIHKMEADLIVKLNATPDDRFWIALIATLLVGAKIANGLQLTSFNIPKMRDVLFREFNGHKSETINDMIANAAPALDVVKEFVNTYTESGTIWDDIDNRGMNVGSERRQATRHPIMYEYGLASKRMKVNLIAFKEWLKRNNKKVTKVIRDLERAPIGGYREIRAPLGAGQTGTMGQDVRVFLVTM